MEKKVTKKAKTTKVAKSAKATKPAKTTKTTKATKVAKPAKVTKSTKKELSAKDRKKVTGGKNVNNRFASFTGTMTALLPGFAESGGLDISMIQRSQLVQQNPEKVRRDLYALGLTHDEVQEYLDQVQKNSGM